MDTKSKNNRRGRAALAAVLTLAVLATAVTVAFGFSYGSLKQAGYSYYNTRDFLQDVLKCLLVRYWQAVCSWNGETEPSALYLDDTNTDYYLRVYGREVDDAFVTNPVDGTSEEVLRRGGVAVYGESMANGVDRLNEMFRREADSLAVDWNNLYCTIIEDSTGRVFAPRVNLSGFTEGKMLEETEWDYILLVRYDAAGSVVDQTSWSYSLRAMNTDVNAPVGARDDACAHITDMANYRLFDFYDFRPPRGVTILFAIPRVLTGGDRVSRYVYWEERQMLVDEFHAVQIPVVLPMCLLALFLGRRRGSGLGTKRLAHWPPEVPVLLLAGTFFFTGIADGALFPLLESWAKGSLAEDLFVEQLSVELPVLANALAFVCAAAGVFVCLAAYFVPMLALRQGVAVYGGQGFVRRSLCVRAAERLWRAAQGAWRVVRTWAERRWQRLTRVDLREPADRTLIRLLTVNAAILTLICCFWFAGIAGVALYSVALYFLLRGRMRAIQADYEALLQAARHMAAGSLDVPVADGLGLFDPLGSALNEVRAGFEKAVEEEVRSRNMKTELITNVSHDLKTPLTAIITYVGLLKDPSLTPETRAQYVETLDKKSQRLKGLIEDLFEISKAASGNAVMNYAQVDLAALLRQAACEMEDAIAQSGVEFRWQLPENRVPLVLDGQKTYRIFENLIVNITKYALPGTRAYITLTAAPDGAQVVFKNVSATELDFDTAAITERFVRGDRARSTEGSGLGLAIAKSFAELQGGSFSVVTDGDLFKAVVKMPLDGRQAARGLCPLDPRGL